MTRIHYLPLIALTASTVAAQGMVTLGMVTTSASSTATATTATSSSATSSPPAASSSSVTSTSTTATPKPSSTTSTTTTTTSSTDKTPASSPTTNSSSSTSSGTASSTSSSSTSNAGGSSKFSIKSVDGANACQNYDIMLEHGEPPFDIGIFPINASMDNWNPLTNLTKDKTTDDRKYTWNVPYAPGTQLVIGAQDKSLTRVLSGIFIVGESSNLNCLPPGEATKAKSSTKKENKGLSRAVIVAIVVVALLAILLIAGLIYYYIMRKRQRARAASPIDFDPQPTRFEIEEDDNSAYNYQPEVTPFVITPPTSQAWGRHPEPEMFGAYDTVTSTPYPAHIYPGMGSGAAAEVKPLPMAPATLAPPMTEHGQYPSPTYSSENPYSGSSGSYPLSPGQGVEPEHTGLHYLQEDVAQYEAAYRPQWTGAGAHT